MRFLSVRSTKSFDPQLYTKAQADTFGTSTKNPALFHRLFSLISPVNPATGADWDGPLDHAVALWTTQWPFVLLALWLKLFLFLGFYVKIYDKHLDLKALFLKDRERYNVLAWVLFH
jgi:hypothetical protein